MNKVEAIRSETDVEAINKSNFLCSHCIHFPQEQTLHSNTLESGNTTCVIGRLIENVPITNSTLKKLSPCSNIKLSELCVDSILGGILIFGWRPCASRKCSLFEEEPM